MGSWGGEEVQLALRLFFADGKQLFFFLGHSGAFSVIGFDHHLVSGGEVFFDLLELAVLLTIVSRSDAAWRVSGTRGISDDLGVESSCGHFLVAGV